MDRVAIYRLQLSTGALTALSGSPFDISGCTVRAVTTAGRFVLTVCEGATVGSVPSRLVAWEIGVNGAAISEVDGKDLFVPPGIGVDTSLSASGESGLVIVGGAREFVFRLNTSSGALTRLAENTGRTTTRLVPPSIGDGGSLFASIGPNAGSTTLYKLWVTDAFDPNPVLSLTAGGAFGNLQVDFSADAQHMLHYKLATFPAGIEVTSYRYCSNGCTFQAVSTGTFTGTTNVNFNTTPLFTSPLDHRVSVTGTNPCFYRLDEEAGTLTQANCYAVGELRAISSDGRWLITQNTSAADLALRTYEILSSLTEINPTPFASVSAPFNGPFFSQPGYYPTSK
ncbi:MAG: hypothetical protein AB7P04_01280 [Bacteriovoracia bacterium]